MGRGPRGWLAIAALALVAGTASPAGGQEPGAGERAPGPASAAARSLVLPGWGQHALGRRRGVAYAVAEAALWAFWADRRRDGNALRTAYRDLAWETGRIHAGARQEGAWAFYEALSKWGSSGSFDADPSAPGVQPEEDRSTYNGSIWSLAKGIHFRGAPASPGDPAYEAALAWYRARAFTDGFLWDWEGRGGALEEYRRLIRGSDDRFRQATTALGAILANHLLSGTDAFVSAHLPGSAEVRLLAPTAWPATRPWIAVTWRPPA